MFKNLFKKDYSHPLDLIAKSPRYTKGEFSINGKIIKFPDAVSFAFIYREVFNQEIYKFKTNSLNPFIIDCGANIGLSVIYFKQLYPNSEILAFEPDPFINNYLVENLSINNFNNVTIVNKGLWDEDGYASFISEGSDSGKISNSFHSRESINEKETVKIEVVRLSKYLIKEVDFLKIDIEGAEVKVIKEIENQLHLVKRIFIEYHSFKNKPQELNTILKVLSDQGFRYYINTPVNVNRTPLTNSSDFMGMDGLVNIFGINCD